jgi:hypothetical protein
MTASFLLFAVIFVGRLTFSKTSISKAWPVFSHCNAFASSHGARIEASRSSSVVKITGIALGWIGFTTAFASVVREP